MSKWTNTDMDDDEFLHSPTPDLLLAAACDEILSWVIEIRMKTHLVRDSNCNSIYV